MTKAVFLELLEKYEKGQCNNKETKVLFAYCEQIQKKNVVGNLNLSEKEVAKVRLLNRINSTINKTEKDQPIKRLMEVKYIASLLVIALISGAIYFITPNEKLVPENAITLELEDGSIRILQENQVVNIKNSDGITLGQQTGNTLQYKHNQINSETLSYNTLRVPNGKTFQLELSDGTRVHLNAGSSIYYPINFEEKGIRKVSITGEAYLQVAKDSLQPFIVGVEHTNIRVLGTEFNVNAYPEDLTTEVTLVEGLVALYQNRTDYKEDQAEKLYPGFKASINRKTQEISKNSVITSLYTSWREGEMVFRNMSFENILRKLERKYDVKIVNKNQQFKHKKFNASFGKDTSLKQVLNELEQMYNIHYKFQENQITVK